MSYLATGAGDFKIHNHIKTKTQDFQSIVT